MSVVKFVSVRWYWLFLFFAFGFSVYLRSPYFGVFLSDGNYWVTTSTLKFNLFWYLEGITNLNFTMFEGPRSIELRGMDARIPYVSYPIGAMLPVFFISKLFSIEPNLSIIMGVNLTVHFIVAMFIAAYSRLILQLLQCSKTAVNINTVAVGVFAIFNPVSMYFHQNVYIFDMAVMAPLVIFLYLELLRDVQECNARWLSITQFVIAFYGTYTEWLFVCLLLVVFVKRLVLKQIPHRTKPLIVESILFWAPSALAMALFVGVLYKIGQISRLIQKYQMRSGDRMGFKEVYELWELIWKRIYFQFEDTGALLLPLAFVLIVISGFFLIYFFICNIKPSKQVRVILSSNLCQFLPIFLFVGIVPNMMGHSFTGIKFENLILIAPTMVVATLLLIPQISYPRIKRYLVWAPLVFICVYFWRNRQESSVMRHFHSVDQHIESDGRFIRGFLRYEDIAISPDIRVFFTPPQLLSLTNKLVYQFKTTKEVKDNLPSLVGSYKGDEYNFVYIFLSPRPDALQDLDDDWKHLVGKEVVDHAWDGRNLHLYRVKPKTL